MIKISISPTRLDDLAKQHYEKILKDYKTKEKLEATFNSKRGPNRKLIGILLEHHQDIIMGKPDRFDVVIDRIDKEIEANYFTKKISVTKRKRGKSRTYQVLKNAGFIKEIKNIFDYDEFSGHHPNKYCAYDLVLNLGVNICPYCNRQYVTNLPPIKLKRKTMQRGTRCTLDHFYTKSTHPYLAISFWNLIPSCYSCNSLLRGDQEIQVNPYMGCFDQVLKFSISPKSAAAYAFSSNLQDLEIRLKRYNEKVDSAKLKICQNNASVFRIQEIYNLSHKDYVLELMQLSEQYTKSQIEQLHTQFPNAIKSVEEAKRLVFRNYTQLSELGDRPLAKLTRDIAKELDLI